MLEDLILCDYIEVVDEEKDAKKTISLVNTIFDEETEEIYSEEDADQNEVTDQSFKNKSDEKHLQNIDAEIKINIQLSKTPTKKNYHCKQQQCDFETSYLVNYKRHLNKIHNITLVNIIFKEETEEIKPKENVEKTPIKKTYECIKCDFKSNYSANYRRHLKRSHRVTEQGIKRITQDKSKVVQKKTYLLYVCELCNHFESRYPNNYNRHMKNVHEIDINVKKEKDGQEKKTENDDKLDSSQNPVEGSLDMQKIKIFQCDVCPYETTFIANYKRHLSNIHNYADENVIQHTKNNFKIIFVSREENEKSFLCEFCYFQTKHESNLRRHLKNVHKVGKKQTQNDEDQETNTEEIAEESKEKLKLFRCQICSYQSTFVANYKRHLENIHNTSEKEIEELTSKFILIENDDCFDDSQNFAEESCFDGSKIKLYQCELCTYQSTFIANYKRHLANIHNNTDEEIEQLLQEFILTEKKCAKIYMCSLCKFRSGYSNSYRRHLRTMHKLNKNLEKIEDNENDFEEIEEIKIQNYDSRNSAEDSEMNVEKYNETIKIEPYEEKIETFQCEKCSYQTTYIANFKRHLTCIHKIAQEELPSVNKKPKISSIKLFKCDLCKFQSRYLANYKRHVKNVHIATKKKKKQRQHYDDEDTNSEIEDFQDRNTDVEDLEDTNTEIDDKDLEDTNTEINVEDDQDRNIEIYAEDIQDSNTEIEVEDVQEIKMEIDDSYNSKSVEVPLESHNNSKKSKTNKIEIEKCYECAECQFKTKRKPNLKTHISIMHKRFKCDQCPFRSKWRFHVNRHMALAHKTTENTDDLESDKNKASQIKSEKCYSCDQCDYETKKLDHVRRHIQVMHNPSKKNKPKGTETPYKCDRCPFVSKFQHNITRHIEKVHERAKKAKVDKITTDKKFKCDKCPYFKSDFEENYRKHLKWIHKAHPNKTNTSMSEYYDVIKLNPQELQLLKNAADENQEEQTTEDKTDEKLHEEFRSKVRKNYKCDKCDFQSKYETSLKRHLARAHTNELLKCSLCPYETKVFIRLKSHIALHKKKVDITLYHCDKCDYQTCDERSFKKHTRSVHEEDTIYSCKFCEFRTTYKRNMGKHLKNHNFTKDFTRVCKTSKLNQNRKPINDVVYHCASCTYKTDNRNNFVKHQNAGVHKPKEIQKCQQCDFETIYKQKFKQHLETVHGSLDQLKTFVCLACDAKFLTKETLITHKRTHPGLSRKKSIKNTKRAPLRETFRCKECFFETKLKQNLLQHLMSIHGNAEQLKSFVCFACGAKFYTKRRLIKHKLKHIEQLKNIDASDNKELVPKETDSEKSSDDDEMTDKSTKMMKCQECLFESQYKRDLRKHSIAVHGNVDQLKTFVCLVCGAKFFTKHKLEKHKFGHIQKLG